MAENIDFEDLLNVNQIFAVKENTNASPDTQEPLSSVLDVMYETLDVDRIELSVEHLDEKTADDVIVNDSLLEEFKEILNETCVTEDNSDMVETINRKKTPQKEKFECPCRSFVFDVKENVVSDAVIADNILHDDKQLVHNGHIDEENDDLSPTTIGLAEFHKIYTETCFTANLGADDFERIANDIVETNHANQTSLFTSLSENSIKIIENLYDIDGGDINLDEFESNVLEENIDTLNPFEQTSKNNIKISEIEENVVATTLLCPVIDSGNVNKLKNTDTSEINNECKNIEIDVNIKLKENTTQFLNNAIAIKDDSKTIEIDLTLDDIISLSSESDDGYNSSDFEFISESEANRAGIIVKGFTHSLNKNKESAPNTVTTPDYIKYHRNNYIRCRAAKIKADRESHVIPVGKTFLDLFRGMHHSAIGGLYSTNKHVLPAKSMTFDTDGFGFDLPEKVEENPKLKSEADETAIKIRFLYPDENRKRRRL